MKMPSSNKLSKLLDLYPVEALKDAFSLSGTKEKVVVDASRRGFPAIAGFAKKYFPITKQHVYGFVNESGKIPDGSAPLLAGELVDGTVSGKELTQFYLATERLEFLVESDSGIERQAVELFWPVQLHFTAAYLLVRCTILERDLSGLFPDGKIVGSGKKSRDDQGVIKEIFETLGVRLGWARLDMNKAIKDLWQNDEIDALTAKFKKARSTTEEAMDEDFTLKKTEPNVYRNLVAHPLQACTFLFLHNQDRYGRGFYCHATDGHLRFTRYSRDSESTDHVIHRILELNF